MTHELQAIFFDFDGTIAETERHGHRVAYNRAFVDYGLDWHWDENLYGELLTVAGGKERLRHYLARYRPERVDEALSLGLIESLHQAKIAHFAKQAPFIPLRPGVLRLIHEAHAAGVALAIVTTAARAGVEALLAREKGLLEMFSLIAANEAVARKKPEPDIYLWTMEQLNLKAENCVAIEDSSIGLNAAMSAGLATVVTVSDYTREDHFRGARAVLTGLGDRTEAARCLAGSAPLAGLVDLGFLRSICASTPFH